MKEKKTEVITIRVTTDTKEGLKKEAEKIDWSISKLAEKILTSWVKQQNKTETAGPNIQFIKNQIEQINF